MQKTSEICLCHGFIVMERLCFVSLTSFHACMTRLHLDFTSQLMYNSPPSRILSLFADYCRYGRENAFDGKRWNQLTNIEPTSVDSTDTLEAQMQNMPYRVHHTLWCDRRSDRQLHNSRALMEGFERERCMFILWWRLIEDLRDEHCN